jgi:hypothetical protein
VQNFEDVWIQLVRSVFLISLATWMFSTSLASITTSTSVARESVACTILLSAAVSAEDRSSARLSPYAETEKGHQDRLLPMTPDFAEFLLQTPKYKWTGHVSSCTASTAASR